MKKEKDTGSAQTMAGMLLLLAGSISLMGIITAEIFYPQGYSTSQSEISDLGATRPPNSVINQPSASIFNGTMLLAGALSFAAALLLDNAGIRRSATIPLALLGAGMFGVGVFPGNVAPWHAICALVTFVSGGIAAIASTRVITGPLRYAAAAYGCVSLFALFFNGMFIPITGDGGIERWVAYPLVLWMTGYGGYLLGSENSRK